MSELKRICIHWTAGSWTPNDDDKKHYHFIINGSGGVVIGKFKPEDNINCKDGRYAAHCGGGNTGTIGVAIAGMFDFKNAEHTGAFPIRKQQFESAMSFIAKICKKYLINIKSDTVFTHKEFGDKHPDTESFGKIDICYLPCYPKVKPEEMGDFIRDKIKWYLKYGD